MTVALRGMTWDDPRGWGPLDAAVRAFVDSTRTDLDVTWDVQPLAGFESRPIGELAERYHLINMDHPHVGEAAAAGVLLPIGEVTDDYVGPSFASYVWAGQLWAMPIDAACQCAAFHPDRLDRPPTTYDEVIALARANVRVAASLHGVHALMALLTLAAQLGRPFGDDPPASGTVIPAAELLRRITRACSPASLSLDPIALLRGMARGEHDYAVFTFAYAPFQRDGLGFTPTPTPDGSPPHGATLGGTGVAVSRHTPHPAEAVALARFLGSRDVQADLWPAHRGQPAHREAWDRLRASGDPFYRDLRPAMDTAYTRPRFAGWNRLQLEAGRTVNRWLAADQPAAVLHDELASLWRVAPMEHEHS